jgi:hypothetical protein
LYLVYSQTPVPGGYCGWHYFGSCGGSAIEYAYILNMDNIVGCSSPVAGGHSAGLSAIANVSAHEISETLTDPDVNGWRNPTGAEIGDLCNFTFDAPSTTLSNGAVFALQDEWSNEANDAGYGFAGPMPFQAGRGCQPAPPSSHVVAWISAGPDPFQATVQQYCKWTASAAGGTPPYTYAWSALGSNLLYPTGSGATFTENSFSPNNYTLTLTASDAKGQQYVVTRTVKVVSFPVGFCSTIP